jgi:hypothetical protein
MGAEALERYASTRKHRGPIAEANPSQSKPIQDTPKESKEKGRESKAKILGFPWIPSSDSGLFNGLQPKFQKPFSPCSPW